MLAARLKKAVLVLGTAVVAGAVLAVSIPLMIHWSAHYYMYGSIDAAPNAKVALVLGASVAGKNELSVILKDRADTAVQLYMARKVDKILVSGDNRALDYDEVSPVRRYLVSMGVAPQDIFLDHAGFDTYSSMYRARDVFGVTSVLVVSQPFHLPRALFIARALGLEAYGVSSGNGDFSNTMREVPASDKAFIDVIFFRLPKYLGPQFPISGDGQATWQ
ncbi:MAG: hypothetical protein JWO43_209 [Candidatus Adlerbacteria bacterium]|nr:hypothetical protein [Candidatus Adlerbacteria bacterium]